MHQGHGIEIRLDLQHSDSFIQLYLPLCILTVAITPFIVLTRLAQW